MDAKALLKLTNEGLVPEILPDREARAKADADVLDIDRVAMADAKRAITSALVAQQRLHMHHDAASEKLSAELQEMAAIIALNIERPSDELAKEIRKHAGKFRESEDVLKAVGAAVHNHVQRTLPQLKLKEIQSRIAYNAHSYAAVLSDALFRLSGWLLKYRELTELDPDLDVVCEKDSQPSQFSKLLSDISAAGVELQKEYQTAAAYATAALSKIGGTHVS